MGPINDHGVGRNVPHDLLPLVLAGLGNRWHASCDWKLLTPLVAAH